MGLSQCGNQHKDTRRDTSLNAGLAVGMGKNAEPQNMGKRISRAGRPRSDVSRSYDRLSPWYDLLTGLDQRLTRMALGWLALQPGERVLDIGCGTGSSLLDLSRISGRAAGLFGCDLSTGMLTRARFKMRRAGAPLNLTRADAVRLPFIPASFDALLLSFTLELFDSPEIPCVLAESQRVLKPGGRLLLVSLAKTAAPGLMERMYEWLHAHLESVADCRPIDSRQDILQAGFTVRQSRRETIWGLPVDLLLAGKPTGEEK